METIVMDLYYNDRLEPSHLAPESRLLDNEVAIQGNETENQTNGRQQSTTDVSSIIFLLGVLLFIFGFSLVKYWLCEGPAEARRRNQARANRRELIRERILSKTVVRKVENHNNDNENSDTSSTIAYDESRLEGGLENEKHKIRRQKTDLEISASQHNQDDASRVECQICLCDFQVGDRICWSNNPQCVHTFHIDCLEPWLMKHNHCPLCRCDYLVPPRISPENHNVEPSNNTRVLPADNPARMRGIMAGIILPLFQHATHPPVVNSQSDGNSTLPSVPSTNVTLVGEEITNVETTLPLETTPQSQSVFDQIMEDMDSFDVETGECSPR